MRWPFVSRARYNEVTAGLVRQQVNHEAQLREGREVNRRLQETADNARADVRATNERYASLVTEMLAMKREGFVVPSAPVEMPEPVTPGPNAMAAILDMSTGKSDPFYAANYAFALEQLALKVPDDEIAAAIRRGR